MSGRFWFTLLAPVALGLVLFLPSREEPDEPSPEVGLISPLKRYRVGHDWVETPPSPPAPKARHLLQGEVVKNYQQCQDKNCPTCQWTQLFGGEW